MRYRVELEELLAFVDRLQSFERRAEAIAARVDSQTVALHDTWRGRGGSSSDARRVDGRRNTDV